MQTKSEMINRIAELAEEVEQRKHEYEVLDACLELAQGKIAELKAYKDVNEDFKTAWEELKAENDRLKEKLESLDRLNNNMKETNKYYTKQIKKINTLLNKLDKKDTNVKAIKQLIKEMLCQRI